MELERERLSRDDEHARATIRERRTCYIGLNRAARSYLNTIRGRSYALESPGHPARGDTSAVATARRDYQDKYSEAQMIVPDSVLQSARSLNLVIANAYSMLMRIEEGTSRPDESPESARKLVEEGFEALRSLRREMRRELGITAE